MGLRRRGGSDGPPTHPAIVARNRRAWRRVGMLAVVLVVPLAVWVGVTVLTRGPIPEARPLEEHAVADGSGEVTVRWTAQPCEQVAADRTDVVELSSEVLVVLRVIETEEAAACERPAERTHVITLDEPLGTRPLLDGACVAPENRRDPRCHRLEREIDVVGPSSDDPSR